MQFFLLFKFNIIKIVSNNNFFINNFKLKNENYY